MGTEYTRKEVETINGAWSAVTYRAEQDRSASRMLREAERYERRERSSLTAARALLLESIFNLDSMGAVKDEEPTAADLFYFASGCASAAIVGAHWRNGGMRDKEYDALKVRAMGAVKVHSESVHRTLAAIR